jgi:translocation and assembly module TamB
VEWSAKRLSIVQHPDLRLIVSGSGSLAVKDARIALAGELQADRGRVELRSNTAPALSSDVVVAGQERPVPISERALNSTLDLRLDLGEDFRVNGRGAQMRLGGNIRLHSTPGTPLQAEGDIAVRQGTYEAYGQKLDIEKGILRFTGLLDNPALEVRAMRKNQEVEAGVEVTGTARDPRVRLVSEPDVPDPEKLSWLVLGTGLEAAGTADAQKLQMSAIAMSASLGTLPLQQQLKRATGLDAINYIPGTDTSEGGVVAIGKRISDRVYLSHEYGLNAASSTFRLSYQLSRYWSVRTESGETDAVDLFFTFSFD